MPLRQLNGSNSARQLIGSKFFQFFEKSTHCLNSFVNCYPLFFSRTFGNLLVPKTPAIYWFQFFRKDTTSSDHTSLWADAQGILVNRNESYSVNGRVVGSSSTCGAIFLSACPLRYPHSLEIVMRNQSGLCNLPKQPHIHERFPVCCKVARGRINRAFRLAATLPRFMQCVRSSDVA